MRQSAGRRGRAAAAAAAGLLAWLGAAGVSGAREGSLCESEPAATCGAGDLPRVSERTWDDATVRRFVERAAGGTVAVALAPTPAGVAAKVRLVEACRLPGQYTEVRTKPGSGRLWATNRALLLPSEIDDGCNEATHEIVAFARGAPTKAKAAASAFSAILVPLPCPSITDASPARRCVGRGADGAARLDSAVKMMKAIKLDKVGTAPLSHVLGVYALAPDEPRSLAYAGRGNSECALGAHARWAAMQYHITLDAGGKMVAILRPPGDPERGPDQPVLDVEASQRSCLHQPVFRKCFAGIADPLPGATGCWEAVPAPAKKP